tara:strand:- start:664 stop:1092 length:429 start_codon:yes stop_codon:yes gene_type:complete
MSIKTFKGKIKDGEIKTIRLSTNNGLTGYKIVKFQIMPTTDVEAENTILIKSVEPTTASSTIDFDDPTLLGAAFFSMHSSAVNYPEDLIFVVDSKIINQDIYVTNKGHSYTPTLNYYLELETVKLDLNEATVATLKDMRGRE